MHLCLVAEMPLLHISQLGDLNLKTPFQYKIGMIFQEVSNFNMAFACGLVL